MVKCPQCRGQLVRYSLRTRKGGTRIHVECEACGHAGAEFPLAHLNDTSAALSAVQAFDTGYRESTFLISAPSTVQ